MSGPNVGVLGKSNGILALAHREHNLRKHPWHVPEQAGVGLSTVKPIASHQTRSMVEKAGVEVAGQCVAAWQTANRALAALQPRACGAGGMPPRCG